MLKIQIVFRFFCSIAFETIKRQARETKKCNLAAFTYLQGFETFWNLERVYYHIKQMFLNNDPFFQN